MNDIVNKAKANAERVADVLKDVTSENICDYYAKYSNLLDSENNEFDKEEREFLLLIVDLLKANLAHQYMTDHGYRRTTKSDWQRWEKD